jgi:hypothetical protein
MNPGLLAWLKGRSKGWLHLQQVPFSQLWALLVAVFLLFSTISFYIDLMYGGRLPYVVVLANAILGGLNAMAWILVLARLPVFAVLIVAALQILNIWNSESLAFWIERTFHPPAVEAVQGIHIAASSTLVAVMSSYLFFVLYFRMTGKETFRLRTELDLAHSIQKTLVPAIARTTRCFEIYGISTPSEKVGGDLVDVVELLDGDTVAYLADIAGHGLQAGILMGMLKTAARVALMDGTRSQGGAALATLMERLNLVLPGVKEAHMYATFTALRLNLDGECFYGLAASPPLLHWQAARRRIARIEEQQFPLGLLPVTGFTASRLSLDPGDLLVITTDGILEVTSQAGFEFGVEGLEPLIAEGAALPLPELAASMFAKVRSYGKQLDDQTLLLVRRTAR